MMLLSATSPGQIVLGCKIMKGYSTFPKTPALLKPHHQIVLCHIKVVGVLALCRDAGDAFYSSS